MTTCGPQEFHSAASNRSRCASTRPIIRDCLGGASLDFPGPVLGLFPVSCVASGASRQGLFQRCGSIFELSCRRMLGNLAKAVTRVHGELHGIAKRDRGDLYKMTVR